ncbi:MAG TPA: S53 family peptidase [Conexibacter sp.]|nr:S53 family peptidase [Conexibacter sp.]
MNVLRRTLLAGSALALLALLVAPLAGASADSQRRVCPGPAGPGTALCHAHVVTDGHGSPKTTAAPAGYGPAQFRAGYNLPSAATTAQTIAIVDAYDDPTVASDLNAYSSTYGLPQCNSANPCFKKVNQNGVAGSYPSANSGWALEISLDVEIAHAICPNCKILLVEASSASMANLETAVNTAARLGATEISNSYGGSEFSGETGDTAYDHPGIAVTVSSGDNGYGQFGFPAASPSVVAVGGTTLKLGAGNAWASETAWSGSGSGCSNYLSAPTWQANLANWSLTGCGTARGVADVAADADPNTGAAVYDTTRYQGHAGWFKVGGTSLSSPLVAGIYALAGNASSASYPATLAYGDTSALHDVTSGTNGTCGTIMCKAAAGYDGPTGLGSPNGLGAF